MNRFLCPCVIALLFSSTLLRQEARAQVYTDENKSTLSILLQGGWDMLDYEFWWGYTLGSPVLPPGFNTHNIIETNVLILSDPDLTTGKPIAARPFYQLNWRSSGDGAGKATGGQYHLVCTDAPPASTTQCAVNLSRGPGPSSTSPNQSFFTIAEYSSPTAPRVYVKLEYLNTGVAANTQVNNDYWFPIGGWNMNTSPSNPDNTKAVSLTNLDIGKIASVSAFILSDPVNGKIEADCFERRGFPNTVLNGQHLKRGGQIEVVPVGSSCSAHLHIVYKANSDFDNNSSMYSGSNYASTSANRGWVKVTYAGTATGVKQPYAVKTRFEQIGSWSIPPGPDTFTTKSLPFHALGVAANRLMYGEANIHSDPIGSDQEHMVTSLRRTAYGSTGQNSWDHGLFVIDEATDNLLLLASSSPATYFNSNHGGTTANRGWFRVDYLAAQCNEGSGYTRAFLGYTASGDDCHGNYGSGTGAIHVIQNQGNDIWNSSDQCAFIYKSNTAANLTITARVDQQENTSSWAKAGVMFRTGTTANSAEVSMLVTPGNGAQWTYRAANGGTTSHPATNSQKAPLWVRVIKSGNNYTGYTSTNGSTWVQLGGTLTVSTGSTYYTGLAATSNNSELNTSVFSNVSF